MTEDPKRSPLDARHRALGAKIVPFAGWEMPLEYQGTLAEHASVREAAGQFDVSHLGKLAIRGAGSRDLLDRALTNRYSDLAPGRARYSLILNEDGGIVDDLIVYATEDWFLAVPNASNAGEVRAMLEEQARGAVEIRRLDWATIAVQGPRSREVVGARFPGAADLGYMRCMTAGDLVVARSGYTGELGYEVFAPPEVAGDTWDDLLESVRAAGGRPCGLGARDTLRLEMGYHLHGSDMDAETTPREAGLEWAVASGKPEFTGKAAYESRRPRKTLIGLRMQGRQIPRHGHAVLRGGVTIGAVTSGNFSPVLRAGIALAYVAVGCVEDGDEVAVDVRGRPAPARVARPPFVDRSPKG